MGYRTNQPGMGTAENATRERVQAVLQGLVGGWLVYGERDGRSAESSVQELRSRSAWFARLHEFIVDGWREFVVLESPSVQGLALLVVAGESGEAGGETASSLRPTKSSASFLSSLSHWGRESGSLGFAGDVTSGSGLQSLTAAAAPLVISTGSSSSSHSSWLLPASSPPVRLVTTSSSCGVSASDTCRALAPVDR